MSCKEAEERITALVDNELSDLERYAIESHFKNCSRCQYIYTQEQELKRQIRFIGAGITAPNDLKERVLSDRRLFPQTAESTGDRKGQFWPSRVVLYPAFALALLVLLLLPTFYLMWPTGKPIALVALDTHRRIVTAQVSFIRTGSRMEVKQMLYRSVGGEFAPMGYDLSAEGLKAVGGFVSEIEGRKVLVAVYKGRGHFLSCFTFLGTEEDVPWRARLFFDSERKMNFYSFASGEINGVMKVMGKRICILVSKMPMGKLLDLSQSL